MQKILYLNRQDVQNLCAELDCLTIIREVFRQHALGQTILPDEAYLSWTNGRGESVRSLNMPGYISGVVGTKIINGNPQNVKRGLPRASGVTLLYDDETGRIVCMLEAAYISSLRTASVTLMAVRLLEGPAIQNVAIIGAGSLARVHIELLAKNLPEDSQFKLFDLDEGRAQTLQASLEPDLRQRLQITANAENAIRDSELVVPVTTTTVGYIRPEWLGAGTIVVNISLDDVLPETVLQADKVYVDDWRLIQNDERRLFGRLYREGRLAGPETLPDPNIKRVDAELGDLVTGRKTGRAHNSEIILVNPFGLAIEDVAFAAQIYKRAQEQNVGIWLEG